MPNCFRRSWSLYHLTPFLCCSFHVPESLGQGQSNLHDHISNQFFGGCLREKVEVWTKPRVCMGRYAGLEEEIPSICEESPFDYMEIRIATGNWDSATAMGWLVQIILSEILGVPTSVESNMYGSSRDFYDPTGAVDYDRGIGPQPLEVAARLPDGDCRSLPEATSDENYLACAHFQPEFWGNPLKEILEQTIEPPQGTGFLGTETWYVTKFTADEYPEVVSYHGLIKQDNRELLASIFRQPIIWKDYCELTSNDNCTTRDNVAQRAPMDDTEAEQMFADGLYTGYFRSTSQNNCTLYPSNCTGHIANYPCGWSSNMEANLYHLNIPLNANNGPNGGPNGYTAKQLREMWHAANATRSHLIMAWWSPEALYQQYLGTDAEMQRVLLKPYTRECAIARAEWKDECAEDLQTRVGAPEEACDNPVEPLRKLINVGLRELLESPDIPEEAQSPAYDVLRLFQIDNIQLGELFDLLRETPDDPRDAVCTWASQNLDLLRSFVPASYPRVAHGKSHLAFGYVTIAFGSLGTLVIVLIFQAVYRNRDKAPIQYAQFDFLCLLLSGSFLVGLGSILLGLPASNRTCVASIWLVHMGYNLELVPLIVKVAAINRMMEAAREMRRFVIRRETLYKAVAFIGVCLVIFLACWTRLDPPQEVAEYAMTNSKTDYYEEHIAERRYYCSGGSSPAWQFAAVAWNAILLVCASVLAYQSRNVLKRFNESRTLAFLIYSHSVFVVLRIVTFLLAGNVDGSTLDYARGLLYAMDQIFTSLIYFLPKLTSLDQEESSSGNDGANPFSRRISGLHNKIIKASSVVLNNESSGQSSDRRMDNLARKHVGTEQKEAMSSEDSSSQVARSKQPALTEETVKKSDPSIQMEDDNHNVDENDGNGEEEDEGRPIRA